MLLDAPSSPMKSLFRCRHGDLDTVNLTPTKAMLLSRRRLPVGLVNTTQQAAVVIDHINHINPDGRETKELVRSQRESRSC